MKPLSCVILIAGTPTSLSNLPKKFALGENVKQANWPGTRYPQTRMGVEQIIRDAFRAAQDYRHRHKTYDRNSKTQRKNVPPRIDLELEALAEILEGKRLLHCH